MIKTLSRISNPNARQSRAWFLSRGFIFIKDQTTTQNRLLPEVVNISRDFGGVDAAQIVVFEALALAEM
jgi:hypothetical protein